MKGACAVAPCKGQIISFDVVWRQHCFVGFWFRYCTFLLFAHEKLFSNLQSLSTIECMAGVSPEHIITISLTWSQKLQCWPLKLVLKSLYAFRKTTNPSPAHTGFYFASRDFEGSYQWLQQTTVHETYYYPAMLCDHLLSQFTAHSLRTHTATKFHAATLTNALICYQESDTGGCSWAFQLWTHYSCCRSPAHAYRFTGTLINISPCNHRL